MKYLKFAFGILKFIMVTLVAAVLALLSNNWHGDWYFKLYQYWSMSFVQMFGIKEHIHYENKIPLPAQYVLISNHPSGIDVIWLPGRFKVIALSKDEIRHWNLIGAITEAAGVLFVNRRDAESRRRSLIACLEEIKKGNNILIFPEGGCLGKGIHPFKDGAFEIAHITKIPIVPVFVYYEEEETYLWGDIAPVPYIMRLLFKAKNRNGHLYIFDPINPELFENAKALKMHTHELYKKIDATISGSYDRNFQQAYI